MDITSYLLGKQAGGGSTPTLQTKSVTITENTTTEVTPDSGYDGLEKVNVTTNVPSGGADLSDYFTNTLSDGSSLIAGIGKSLKRVPNNMVVNTFNSIQDSFKLCSELLDAPTLDTSNVTNMKEAFYGCGKLLNVPIYNTSKVTNIQNMFSACNSLTNDSLNNIMYMCIYATSYTGTKTLKYVGLTATQATTCQSLSNYQELLNAGWTTGY